MKMPGPKFPLDRENTNEMPRGRLKLKTGEEVSGRRSQRSQEGGGLGDKKQGKKNDAGGPLNTEALHINDIKLEFRTGEARAGGWRGGKG